MCYAVLGNLVCMLCFQKCAPGYYGVGSGRFLGRCARCECNGLADECEDKTGRCLVRNTLILHSFNGSMTTCTQCRQPHTPKAKTDDLSPVSEPQFSQSLDLSPWHSSVGVFNISTSKGQFDLTLSHLFFYSITVLCLWCKSLNVWPKWHSLFTKAKLQRTYEKYRFKILFILHIVSLPPLFSTLGLQVVW